MLQYFVENKRPVNCQCGAVLQGSHCEYCGADYRTDFERKVDKLTDVGKKILGYDSEPIKTPPIVENVIVAARSFMWLWFVLAMIVIVAVLGVAILIVLDVLSLVDINLPTYALSLLSFVYSIL